MRALLALLVASGCTWDRGETLTPVWLSHPENIAAWEDAVSNAAESWDALLLNCGFPFVMGPGGKPVTLRSDGEWNYPILYSGYYSYFDGIDILGNDTLKKRAILMHELGHAFGLEHSSDVTSIMYFAVNSKKVPNEADVVNAREALGCE